MAIETIFFDLGGVILNFSHEQMFTDIANYLNIDREIVARELAIDNLGGPYERGEITDQELFAHFQKLTEKPITLDGLMHSTALMFSPKQEMIPLLNTLKKKGIKLILLSNTCYPHIHFVKTNYDFLDNFDELILSFEVRASKPEEAIYQIALSKTNSPPANCLYIDDVKEYIDAAKSLGIPGHHFRGHKELVKALSPVLE